MIDGFHANIPCQVLFIAYLAAACAFTEDLYLVNNYVSFVWLIFAPIFIAMCFNKGFINKTAMSFALIFTSCTVSSLFWG